MKKKHLLRYYNVDVEVSSYSDVQKGITAAETKKLSQQEEYIYWRVIEIGLSSNRAHSIWLCNAIEEGSSFLYILESQDLIHLRSLKEINSLSDDAL